MNVCWTKYQWLKESQKDGKGSLNRDLMTIEHWDWRVWRMSCYSRARLRYIRGIGDIISQPVDSCSVLLPCERKGRWNVLFAMSCAVHCFDELVAMGWTPDWVIGGTVLCGTALA